MNVKCWIAGACLAALPAVVASDKVLSYRVQVDGTDVPLRAEVVKFGSKHPDSKTSFEGPYWFGAFAISHSVEVTVDCSYPLGKVRILPASAGIVPRHLSENRIALIPSFSAHRNRPCASKPKTSRSLIASGTTFFSC